MSSVEGVLEWLASNASATAEVVSPFLAAQTALSLTLPTPQALDLCVQSHYSRITRCARCDLFLVNPENPTELLRQGDEASEGGVVAIADAGSIIGAAAASGEVICVSDPVEADSRYNAVVDGFANREDELAAAGVAVEGIAVAAESGDGEAGTGTAEGGDGAGSDHLGKEAPAALLAVPVVGEEADGVLGVIAMWSAVNTDTFTPERICASRLLAVQVAGAVRRLNHAREAGEPLSATRLDPSPSGSGGVGSGSGGGGEGEAVERGDISDRMMELAKRVLSASDTETSIRSIMASSRELLGAAGCSVFMLDTATSELYAKVFENQNLETGDLEIRFPVSEGLAGHVASSGECLVTNDPYGDPRFNQSVDLATGFVTKSVLCVPMRNADRIVGVAQLINKPGGFLATDANVLEAFVSFAGVALTQVAMLDKIRDSNERMSAIHGVVKGILAQHDTDEVIKKIVLESAKLLRAEGCSVFLLAPDTNELYAKVFENATELEDMDSPSIHVTATDEIRFPADRGIAGAVATSGVVENIADAYEDERFNRQVDVETGYRTKSILCTPILDMEGAMLGVAQLVNKLGAPTFTASDVEDMMAFSAFCGIALNNARLMEELLVAQSRTKVALELISHHALPEPEVVDTFAAATVPGADESYLDGMNSYAFGTRALDADQSVFLVLRMFLEMGFVDRFSIPWHSLVSFVLTARKNYRQVLYHNWEHAVSVTHTLYAVMRNVDVRAYLDDLDLLAVLVSGLTHDIDHRGVNNAFLALEGSELDKAYGGQSVLEQHHFSHAMLILQRDENNIFVGLRAGEYDRVLATMQHVILSTDLKTHFPNRAAFKEALDAGRFDPRASDEHRKMLLAMVMTCADLSVIAKPWDIQQRVASIIYEEFFQQGDREKEHGKTPIKMMDRTQADIPSQQIGFIDFVAGECYALLAAFDDGFGPLDAAVKLNRSHWEAEATASESDLNTPPKHHPTL